MFTVPESETRLELVAAREPERDMIFPVAVARFVFVVLRFEFVVAREPERETIFASVIVTRPERVEIVPERVAIDPVIVEREPERAFCARRSV